MAGAESGREQYHAEQRLRAEKRRLEAILETIPLGVFIVEGDPPIISYVNRRAQEAYGFANVGLTLEDNMKIVRPHTADLSPLSFDMLPASRALRGEHVRNQEIRLQRPDGVIYQVLTSASPLPRLSGEAPAAVVAFADITERRRDEEALHRSEERLQRELATTRILLQSAEALSAWTDLQSVLETLTHAVLNATSHTRATFALWKEATGEVQVVASAGEEPIPPFAAPALDFSPDFRRVIECQDSVVSDYDAFPPEQVRMAASVHSRKGILVPLSYRSRLVGGLFVDDPGRRGEFPEEEIRLIEGIAAQAAVAIVNARLYEAQANIAATLQQALLELPADIPGVRFSHLYRSATEQAAIGGDFYDLVKLPEDGYLLLIGDVSGHGIEAARSATFVRHAVAAFATEDKDPVAILAETNQALLRRGIQGFVSVLLCRLTNDRRHLVFCSAGHPDFLVRRAAGPAALVTARNALPLGMFRTWSCHSSEMDVDPGDVLFFYTDGVTEARKESEMFGEARLTAWLEGSRGVPFAHLPEAMLAEVLAFTGGALQDDVAVLAVEIR